MPHDVIMPALGMAQDSGVLVAWLKRPGEPVRAGDGLMEVETDKATMEVEAQADGYLTDIRVRAGESAPVGGVVAVIAESPAGADKPAGNGAASAEPAGKPANPQPAKPAEGKPVIMPALGMAQDSGVLVLWTKAVGEAVGADDTLFEVETDKSTMEVPAGADGYLAAQYAEAGASVPVGEVIALITQEEPAADAAQPARPGAAPAPAPAGEPRPEPAPAAAPAPAEPAAPPPRRGGRILASPKARRLARARGLDLQRLLDGGLREPLHAADVAAFVEPPAKPAPVAAAPQAAAQQASAEAPAAPLAAFLDWLATETEGGAGRGEALAAFAAGAFRAATGAERVGLALGPAPRSPERRFADPDRALLTAIAEADTPADLRLRDLGATAITALAPDDDATPTLTLCARGERLRIDYAGHLPPEQAIALLDGFAARLGDPIRHLL